MMEKRAAGHLGGFDDFVQLGVMKPFQRKQLCCVTQNAIACLDGAGLLRRSHMTLQQNTEYLVCFYSRHMDSGVQMGEW
jgi:hypothetical protein